MKNRNQKQLPSMSMGNISLKKSKERQSVDQAPVGTFPWTDFPHSYFLLNGDVSLFPKNVFLGDLVG